MAERHDSESQSSGVLADETATTITSSDNEAANDTAESRSLNAVRFAVFCDAVTAFIRKFQTFSFVLDAFVGLVSSL